jgi:hypothetical protein
MAGEMVSICDQAEQMLTHYLSALSIYHKATLSAAGLAESPRYCEAHELRERASKMLARARGDYWDHISAHKCQQLGLALQNSPSTLRPAEMRAAVHFNW